MNGSHKQEARVQATRTHGPHGHKHWLTSAILLGAVLLFGVGLQASSANAASIKRCQSVVKKIYSNEGFYKAKVLITNGDVACSEARRIIWRALSPGGFNGGINGWMCESKGSYDPFIEKCSQDDPRRVIKSSKPKLCPSCSRNSKRPQD
jgi:hypothetical protein